MPFSKKLVEWCELNPNFMKALKIAYPKDFVIFFGISTSHCPCSNYLDENIGIIVYDKKDTILKQDFIVNKRTMDNEFYLYTNLPRDLKKHYNKYVQGIGAFYDLHKQHGCYKATHHPTLNSLSPIFQKRIEKMIMHRPGVAQIVIPILTNLRG